MKHIVIGLCLALCWACREQPPASAGAAMKMRHASFLTVDSCAGCAVARVRNPWDTARILHAYVLVPKDKPLPDSLPEGTVVRVPLERALVYSSVHCSLLQELGALDAVGGVCDREYINLPEVQARCADGRMADAGSSMNPEVERIVDFAPDAILLSPFENSGGYGRIEKLGIPIVECADYMETSPLGRAEWMRFFGMLFGRAGEADSLFCRVERDYLRLKEAAAGAQPRPTLLVELKSASAWYVPGGRSTMGQLYADSGADYCWADDPRSGSIPLAFETVYDRAHDADFWLVKYNAPEDKTLASLKADYAPYAGFRAFREGRVYGCNTGKVPFYEETPFHPEWLLEDLVRLFHPALLGEGECRYFKRLQP